jgi:hypothetical protein
MSATTVLAPTRGTRRRVTRSRRVQRAAGFRCQARSRDGRMCRSATCGVVLRGRTFLAACSAHLDRHFLAIAELAAAEGPRYDRRRRSSEETV